MSVDAALLWTTSLGCTCMCPWPHRKGRACAKKDSPPLTRGSKVSFPWYQRTARFRAGATFVMSHCSWNSLSSTTEVELSTWRMETLSGGSGEIIQGLKKTQTTKDHDSFKILKNTFQAIDIGSAKQISNTYCREWSLKVSGMFLVPWTWRYKQALDPSLYRCQQTNVYCQFWCPAEPASVFSLLDFWSRWMLACMLHSGPCFDIVSPSCLELFRWGSLVWHLWNVERGWKNGTPVQVTQEFIILT